MVKVAINGFGRIGRLAFREMIGDENVEIVAINDLSDSESLAYLLKYDTVHRPFTRGKIDFNDEGILYNDRLIRVYAEKEPNKLPWSALDVDVVLECTGKFTSLEDANKHIEAGAKKVVISAPGKGDMKTIVFNVNDNILTGDEKIISAASCTTNCLAPVLKVLNDAYGIEKGFMTTVHAYTNDQATLDIPHKKGIKARRGRAAAANIIPASTGAATAIGKVIPELLGKLDGCAYRVPVQDGSLIDLVLELKKNTTVDDINKLFYKKQNETIRFTMDPIVSSDIIGSKVGAVVDGLCTNVMEVNGKQLVKVVAWYDNEMGYTAQMVRTIKSLIK